MGDTYKQSWARRLGWQMAAMPPELPLCGRFADASKCTCVVKNSVISASAGAEQLTFNNPLIPDQKQRTRDMLKALGKSLCV